MDEIAKLLTIIELNLITLGRQYKSGQAVLISDTLEALTKVRHLRNQSNRPPAVCTCPKPTILEKSYCTECGRDMHPAPTQASKPNPDTYIIATYKCLECGGNHWRL